MLHFRRSAAEPDAHTEHSHVPLPAAPYRQLPLIPARSGKASEFCHEILFLLIFLLSLCPQVGKVR